MSRQTWSPSERLSVLGMTAPKVDSAYLQGQSAYLRASSICANFIGCLKVANTRLRTIQPVVMLQVSVQPESLSRRFSGQRQLPLFSSGSLFTMPLLLMKPATPLVPMAPSGTPRQGTGYSTATAQSLRGTWKIPYRTQKELAHLGNEGLSKAVELLAGVKAKVPSISFAGVPGDRRL